MHKKEEDALVALGSKKEEELKEKALSISLKEGSAANVSTSVTANVITPFALELKASPTQVGMLSSISGLLAPLAQFYGDKLMEKYPRKTIAKTYIILQALMLLPFVVISYLAYKGILSAHLATAIIIIFTIYAALGGVVYPSWFSWMGDLVPEKHRGKYFGKRYRVTETWGVIVTLLTGLLLDAYKPEGVHFLGYTFQISASILYGFSILFIVAFLGRLGSYFFIAKQYEPPYTQTKDDYFSIWSFLKRMDNFGKFAVGNAIFNFALMISSPYFAVYMLKDLGLENNYFLFMVISLSSTVFYLLFTKTAGKFSDRYGAKRLFALSTFLFSMNPLIYLIVKNPYYLIPVQIVAGFANAAMTISVNNFTYDAVSQKHRALCITYTNILAGIGTFLGAGLGGLMIKYDWLHPSIMNPILFVFVVSAIGRWAVSLFIIPRIHETRKVKKLSMHIPHFHMHHYSRPAVLHAEIFMLKRHHYPQRLSKPLR